MDGNHSAQQVDNLSVSRVSHSRSYQTVLNYLQTSAHGLSSAEAKNRLAEYGHNSFPQTHLPSIWSIFINQFKSPLIYVLLFAALVSLMIQEWSDAGFISIVLLLNALIGAFQEHSAQRAAVALQKLVSSSCRVLRDGETYQIDAEFVVPGDIVLLESGDRIPADLRLINSNDLEVDESLLTGESLPVLKNSTVILSEDVVLADKRNMLFSGTLINRGRAQGVVVSTGLNTELGAIASDVLFVVQPKAPLQVRMERFTQKVTVFMGVATLLLFMVTVMQGASITEMFLLAVALAVSAIPEGLPVALTVALAIGMRRMVHRHVIVRRLLAVEALGSCTYIATDKTGTLTVNQLTVRKIVSPDGGEFDVTGQGDVPEGEIVSSTGVLLLTTDKLYLEQVFQVAVLANEGFLGKLENGWAHQGDAVDVALLVMAHKAGVFKGEMLAEFPVLHSIPYESERMLSASLNQVGQQQYGFVKGALESLLPMCSTMQLLEDEERVEIQPQLIERQAHLLAAQGYRVLALAKGPIHLQAGQVFSEEHLQNLTLVGLVGVIDPLRPEAKQAIADCRQAGIEVAMITGDHPLTALAIARELDLTQDEQQVVTGAQLAKAQNEQEFDEFTRKAKVFARVGPHQKLAIVHSLQRNGHFVAVSGDGANDAPALRAAQVGVAMGKNGTDVAREAADLIITDDNFKSIVSGVEQGRVAYANVRKVIFLLISTGSAELVLFTLSLLAGLPLPLLAVQLLWLNLVTNGIQDIALAFEPAEGHELQKPPRAPSEPIFNRLMIERVLISALVIGIVAFGVFQWLLSRGFSLDEARNGTLLLMVFFENVHVLNSRSESRSIFSINPFSNPLLLAGVVVAQLVHIGAMYVPWLSEVLQIQPVSIDHWVELLVVALSVLLVIELHKLVRR